MEYRRRLKNRKGTLPPPPRIERREFLRRLKGAGLAGVSLASSGLLTSCGGGGGGGGFISPAFACNSILDCVARFAINIGGQILNQTIEEYILDLPGPLQTLVRAGNEAMANDPMRFVVGPESTVTEVSVSKEVTAFFYPALSEDELNSCAAFLTTEETCDNQEHSEEPCLSEGPTLAGLDFVSAQLTSEEVPEDEVGDLLLPVCCEQAAVGSWGSGYDQTEVLRTRGGTTLAIDYINDWNDFGLVGDESIGSGELSVTIDSGRRRLVWQLDYDHGSLDATLIS